MKYKIFGHLLEIDTNDKVIINAFQSCAGHFIETDIEAMGKIRFAKVSVTRLRNIQFPIEKMSATLSFVQPTKGHSTIYKSLNGERKIHLYERYYVIEYLFNKNLVEFYYTDNIYSILDDLLGEFLKYYIFPKAINSNNYPLHSSCVLKKDSNQCVVFVGDSGCGKSSNALFATVNGEYEFMNDEITYITYCNEKLVAIPTTDKFKICEQMYYEIKEHIKFDFTKINNEYLCDFSSSTNRENRMLDIVCIVALIRDDNAERIEKEFISKLELYDLILRNLHLNLYNTKKDKLSIFECANDIVKNCKLILVKYPTKLIHEVTNQILVGGIA